MFWYAVFKSMITVQQNIWYVYAIAAYATKRIRQWYKQLKVVIYRLVRLYQHKKSPIRPTTSDECMEYIHQSYLQCPKMSKVCSLECERLLLATYFTNTYIYMHIEFNLSTKFNLQIALNTMHSQVNSQ